MVLTHTHGQFVVTSAGKLVTFVEIVEIGPHTTTSIRETPEGCLQRATDTLHASEPNRSSVRRVHQKHIRGEWTSGGNNGGGDAGLWFFSGHSSGTTSPNA